MRAKKKYSKGGKMYSEGGKAPKKAPRRLTPKGPAGIRNKKDVYDLEARAYMRGSSEGYKKNPNSPLKAEYAGLDAIKKARKKKATEGMAANKKLNKALKRR